MFSINFFTTSVISRHCMVKDQRKQDRLKFYVCRKELYLFGGKTVIKWALLNVRCTIQILFWGALPSFCPHNFFLKTLSLLFDDTRSFCVDQDQTAQNVQSDLWSTLSTFFILDCKWTISSSCNGSVFLASGKTTIVYLFGSKRVKLQCNLFRISTTEKASERRTVWKGETCWWTVLSPFPRCFQKRLLSLFKTRVFVVKS